MTVQTYCFREQLSSNKFLSFQPIFDEIHPSFLTSLYENRSIYVYYY